MDDRSENTYSEHELLTYRGRCIQDEKDLGMGYCGSCSLAVHVEQMRDPTSWVHSAVNRWLHAVKLHDAREEHGDYESLLNKYNALLAEAPEVKAVVDAARRLLRVTANATAYMPERIALQAALDAAPKVSAGDADYIDRLQQEADELNVLLGACVFSHKDRIQRIAWLKKYAPPKPSAVSAFVPIACYKCGHAFGDEPHTVVGYCLRCVVDGLPPDFPKPSAGDEALALLRDLKNEVADEFVPWQGPLAERIDAALAGEEEGE